MLAACVALTLAAAPAALAQGCALPEPEVLMREGDQSAPGGRLVQMWELDAAQAEILWSRTEPQGDYARFRAALNALEMDADPVALLLAAQEAHSGAERHNSRVAIDNAGYWIRPAGCLEMLLTGIQHGRMDTFETPSEFAAFVLRSPNGERIRVYFYTNNYDGLGRVDPVGEPVERDHAAGWSVLIGMHNHAFHPGDPGLNGVLAPGASDAGFHIAMRARVGLEEAWITNGLDTIRMPAASFGEFRGESR